VFEYKLSDFPVGEKLEKFMEDVKWVVRDRFLEIQNTLFPTWQSQM
jgi:hypothetical protein